MTQISEWVAESRAVRGMAQSSLDWIHSNITFSMLLAIMTECPRWIYAFWAIDEPLWVGIMLAILISFATSKAWEEYFASYDRLLLGLNLLSLFLAIFTISPVLFAMSEPGVETEISVAAVYPYWLRWGWAIGLASMTFLPLVQVAMVSAYRRERAEDLVYDDSSEWPTVDTMDTEAPPTRRRPTKLKPAKRATTEQRDRALQMMTDGLGNSEIAMVLGVKDTTVRSWRARYGNGHASKGETND